MKKKRNQDIERKLLNIKKEFDDSQEFKKKLMKLTKIFKKIKLN